MLDCQEMCKAYLTFSVNDRTYAVKTSYILEIVEIKNITALPRTAPYILGVSKIRDTIYSIMDLRLKFGAKNPPGSCPAVAILLTCEGAKMGIVVDKVIAVVNIDVTEPTTSVGDDQHIIGVVQVKGASVALLSAECIFDMAERGE